MPIEVKVVVTGLVGGALMCFAARVLVENNGPQWLIDTLMFVGASSLALSAIAFISGAMWLIWSS